MSEAVADKPSRSCYHLNSGSGIVESQQLAPDRFSPRARNAGAGAHTGDRDQRGRFATGTSGNPRGRPRGVPNPKRRVLTVSAFRKNPDAAMALFDRKPHLWRQLVAHFMPPRARPIDPAERIGLDLAVVRTPEDVERAIHTALIATSRGRIAPAEFARLVRSVRGRLRAARRLERFQRRLAQTGAKTNPTRPPLG
jgi:hypothetical protein